MLFLLSLVAAGVAIFGVIRLTAVTSLVEDAERKMANLNDGVKHFEGLVEKELKVLGEKAQG